MLQVGDLVRVRSPNHSSSSLESGIVIEIERQFYSKPSAYPQPSAQAIALRLDRVQVLWNNGSITYEPETWLCISGK